MTTEVVFIEKVVRQFFIFLNIFQLSDNTLFIPEKKQINKTCDGQNESQYNDQYGSNSQTKAYEQEIDTAQQSNTEKFEETPGNNIDSHEQNPMTLTNSNKKNMLGLNKRQCLNTKFQSMYNYCEKQISSLTQQQKLEQHKMMQHQLQVNLSKVTSSNHQVNSNSSPSTQRKPIYPPGTQLSNDQGSNPVSFTFRNLKSNSQDHNKYNTQKGYGQYYQNYNAGQEVTTKNEDFSKFVRRKNSNGKKGFVVRREQSMDDNEDKMTGLFENCKDIDNTEDNFMVRNFKMGDTYYYNDNSRCDRIYRTTDKIGEFNEDIDIVLGSNNDSSENWKNLNNGRCDAGKPGRGKIQLTGNKAVNMSVQMKHAGKIGLVSKLKNNEAKVY